MAIYDYWCRVCGRERTENHGMTETPIIKCKCGTQMVKKLGGCNFVLKGGGWPGQDIKRKDEMFKKQIERENKENIPGPDTLPRRRP